MDISLSLISKSNALPKIHQDRFTGELALDLTHEISRQSCLIY